MRTIVWFIYFWLYLIKIIPNMNRVAKLDPVTNKAERDLLIKSQVANWSKSLLKLAGATVNVEGYSNIPDEPVVFVSNHQGNFDIPILLSTLDRPTGLVAKKELEKLPFLSTWMKYMHCIFIDRKDARQSLKALNDVPFVIENGYSLIIFPEGTRSKHKEMGDFKYGAFNMAFKNKIKIVPIVLNGSYNLMESQGIWIKPATVHVKILPPISTEGLSKQEAKEVAELIKEKIINELKNS